MGTRIAAARRKGAVAALAIGVGFVVGLVVGHQRSGSAAEWAAAAGTVIAAVVALYLADRSSREIAAERERAWRIDNYSRSIDLMTDLLTIIGKDEIADKGRGLPGGTVSPEGIALATRLNAVGFVQLGIVAEHYNGVPKTQADTDRVHARYGREGYWPALHKSVVDEIARAAQAQSDAASAR
jgi:hypothetical protein